jgi:hypothetical protein
VASPVLCLIITALLFFTSFQAHADEPLSPDSLVLHQLQETVHKQQLQLQQQSERIKAQSELLQNLQKQINSLQKPLSPVPSGAELTVQSPSIIASGNDRTKLSISGQLNRAINFTNDGSSTQAYHIDNDASNSRVRFVGSSKISEDLTVSTRIEVAVAPDESSVVSQTNQAPGDYFNQRWAEISLTSETYGKLSIGKGDTASNTTAEVDLSKTDLVQYAGIADISGGMFFREKDDIRRLTSLKVSDSFKSGDGLSRQSRLRFDTPTRYGFRLAGSLVTNQQSDIALFYGTEKYGLKGAGAFAVSNPKQAGANLLYDGSFSLLHTSTGLNLTVSGAALDKIATKDRTNLYVKIGWLTNLTSMGYTAVGVDYTRSENAAATGDVGNSVGTAVVQAFEKFAAEIYFQYRIYSLDRAAGIKVADINVGTFGARVKF